MKLPKSWTTVTTLSKILALAMFVALPFIGFYLGKKYQKNVTISPLCLSCKSNVVKPVNCIFQDKTATLKGLYVDKENNFQLEIPEQWNGKIQDDGSIKMQSPDLLIVNEGYGLPTEGAEISVSEEITRFQDLDEYKRNDLDYGIKGGWILNLRYLTVGGIKALQYEWAWEGFGTTTNFIKNDKFYRITMYYNYDQKSNKKYLESYTNMLSSIRSTEVK